MNESEWLAGEDPRAMLDYLLGTDAVPEGQTSRGRHRIATDRRLRLFAAGCCRLVWPLLTDPRSREAVLVAERYADGLASEEEREAAAREAQVAYARFVPAFPPDMETLPFGSVVNAFAAAVNACRGDDQVRAVLAQTREAGAPPAAQAALLRCVGGNPFWPVRGHTRGLGRAYDPEWIGSPVVAALARAAYDEGRVVRCGYCGGRGSLPRDLLNGDFMTDPCPDCKGTGRTSAGLLDPDHLAVLADALEEAGCDDADLLGHLRGQEKAPPDWYRCRGCGREWKPAHKYDDCGAACEGLEEPAEWIALRGPHARGCWAVDLVLGRA